MNQKEKARDPNRGFKLDATGKLVIEEPKRGGKQDDSDSDDDIDIDDDNATKEQNNESDDDDEATENAKMKARKRKANSAMSQASGKTAGTQSRYVAGGKGIHRPLNGSSAESTRTGYSGKTGASGKTTASTSYGSEYKSKKARGDVKKKDTTYDPYAYIPLSRNSLNKRKRAKSAGQFKSVVAGARKGAAAGSKRRKL